MILSGRGGRLQRNDGHADQRAKQSLATRIERGEFRDLRGGGARKSQCGETSQMNETWNA